MEYKGRKIEVYRFREAPMHIIIDVMQKDGDCPRRYTEKQRYECASDCQNTFLSFTYSVLEEKIVLEGALLNSGQWTYSVDPLIKHGFDPRQMDVIDFVKGIWDDGVSFVRKGDTEVLIYKEDDIGFKSLCEFHATEHYICPDPEVREYQELIRGSPELVMKKGGIGFHDHNGLTIVTFRSDENIRSMFSKNKPIQ